LEKIQEISPIVTKIVRDNACNWHLYFEMDRYVGCCPARYQREMSDEISERSLDLCADIQEYSYEFPMRDSEDKELFIEDVYADSQGEKITKTIVLDRKKWLRMLGILNDEEAQWAFRHVPKYINRIGLLSHIDREISE